MGKTRTSRGRSSCRLVDSVILYFLIFFYLQMADSAKLVQYLSFILNFRKNAYREHGVATGNFKVSLFYFFLFLLLVKTFSPQMPTAGENEALNKANGLQFEFAKVSRI